MRQGRAGELAQAAVQGKANRERDAAPGAASPGKAGAVDGAGHDWPPSTFRILGSPQGIGVGMSYGVKGCRRVVADTRIPIDLNGLRVLAIRKIRRGDNKKNRKLRTTGRPVSAFDFVGAPILQATGRQCQAVGGDVTPLM